MTSTICKPNYAATVKHILPCPQRCLLGAVLPRRRNGRRNGCSLALIRRNARYLAMGKTGVACWRHVGANHHALAGAAPASVRHALLTDGAMLGIMYLTLLPIWEDIMSHTIPPDEKLSALRAHHALNPRPHLVSDAAFTAGHPFFDARDLVQVKYEMLRRVQTEGYPVAQAARAFGFSRPSFYATQRAWQQGGLQGLVPARPGPRRAHKLREEVVLFVEQTVAADPTVRAPQLAELVAERFAVVVHPRSIERALARRGVRHTDPPSRPAQPGRTPPA